MNLVKSVCLDFCRIEWILLRFQLGWKVDIHTFLTIYSKPANSYRKERTTCLKLGLKSVRNVWKLEKHCFLVYYEFQSVQGFLNTQGLVNMCDANLVITWSHTPTIKIEIWFRKAKKGLIGVWHNKNLPQDTNTIRMK
jgi:hypothetical protein